ncbi:MAG: ABC transporter permease, partial [Eubacteriales bacterium]|nr:ABC transporter permease [Eubacteriales bacterium]
MINTLRMDFRRLFKTRSFYFTFLWALALMAIMATASWFLADNMAREAGGLAGLTGGQILSEARKLFNVSRFASFFMGAPSFMHLILVVFAAGYISKDHQSGYFKNLLTLPGAREKWLAGKQLAMLVAGVLFYVVIILGSILVTVLFGNAPVIDVPQLAAFFGLHLTADLALFALLTLTTALLQTRTAAVMVAMVFAFNMQALLYP